MENRLHFAGFCPAKEESGISKIERRLTRYSAKADTTRALGKTKYLFVGLSACAGTTMISMAFAEFIATSAVAAGCRATVVSNESTFSKKRAGTMQAAFVELCDGNDAPKGYDYDRIGIDRHFADRDYISFYKLLSEGRPLKGVCNADGGINWALRVPGEKF
ncbi:MAG: hypothetical protein LBN36_01890, partial [Clostridiales Family XIII bacterium]|nr:hypothetical protein [Clostridiales Family XIII bacterium]